MKKAIGMFAALILALGMTGVGYATWQKSLYINGTVNTGTVDVAWSEEYSWDTDDWVFIDDLPSDIKDVSKILCEIDDLDLNTLHVTVTNAYPSIDYYNVVNIANVGTIPVHLYVVSLNSPAVVEVDISYYYDYDLTRSITELPDGYIQLHPGEIIYAVIHVHITQDAVEGRIGELAYTFDAEIVAVQWNMPWPELPAPA